MTPTILVSYDDTPNDRDALALGRRLAAAGGRLALAYVVHPRHGDVPGELLEAAAAEQLLERGDPSAEHHVIAHASTGEGLLELAERLDASVVVFGSDYRTAAGSVRPGTSAQRLLAGGRAAVAIAPAGLRDVSAPVARIGVLAEGADIAADVTARDLADALGAEVGAGGDLLVVGSRPGTPAGRVGLSAVAEYAVETAACPVLVVPAGSPVPLRARTLTSA
jgi:nucleotide-binding universal stress UspA family protein